MFKCLKWKVRTICKNVKKKILWRYYSPLSVPVTLCNLCSYLLGDCVLKMYVNYRFLPNQRTESVYDYGSYQYVLAYTIALLPLHCVRKTLPWSLGTSMKIWLSNSHIFIDVPSDQEKELKKLWRPRPMKWKSITYLLKLIFFYKFSWEHYMTKMGYEFWKEHTVACKFAQPPQLCKYCS